MQMPDQKRSARPIPQGILNLNTPCPRRMKFSKYYIAPYPEMCDLGSGSGGWIGSGARRPKGKSFAKAGLLDQKIMRHLASALKQPEYATAPCHTSYSYISPLGVIFVIFSEDGSNSPDAAVGIPSAIGPGAGSI